MEKPVSLDVLSGSELNAAASSELRSLWSISPSPENDRLYRPIDLNDPDIIALAQSIREHGLMEPIVVSLDGFIISGHRRHAACRLAGLKNVPVRVEPIFRTDDINAFAVLLREFNRQREKTNDERFREELLTVNPEEGYRVLTEYRRQKSGVQVQEIALGSRKPRSEISDLKRQFADAILRIVDNLREYWPLSERMIHYRLIDERPMRSTGRKGKPYVNDRKSSQDLSDMVVRMRLSGEIPFEAIHDPTRPVTVWQTHKTPRTFIRDELNQLLKGYYRDLMQSQPNHVEILVEKNTVVSILEPVAGEYAIPITSGRGFSSHAPFRDIQQRFLRSGKDRLILIVCSDLDPSGESIAESAARNLRDDYGIDSIVPIKAAITMEQVQRFKLPPMMSVDDKQDKRAAKFEARHGKHVYELEALAPDQLIALLKDAIDSVIDREAFNREIDAEKQDAAWLDGVRRSMTSTFEIIERQLPD